MLLPKQFSSSPSCKDCKRTYQPKRTSRVFPKILDDVDEIFFYCTTLPFLLSIDNTFPAFVKKQKQPSNRYLRMLKKPVSQSPLMMPKISTISQRPIPAKYNLKKYCHSCSMLLPFMKSFLAMINLQLPCQQPGNLLRDKPPLTSIAESITRTTLVMIIKRYNLTPHYDRTMP